MDKSTSLKTDVFIAGAGPAGCTFARILAQSGRQVLMADTGPQLSARAGAHLKNAVVYQRDVDRFTPIVLGLLNPYSVPPRPGYTLSLDPISYTTDAAHASTRSANNPRQDPYRNLPGAACSFAVGGMLTHWTNNTPRHHPRLERISFISAEEWDQLYSVAEGYLNTHNDAFDMSVRHRTIREVLERHYGSRLPKGYEVQSMPMGVERRKDNPELVYWTGSDNILQPLIDDSSKYPQSQFRILPEHRVKQLRFEGGRVTNAVVTNMQTNETIEIAADLFVVAAGAVLGPQLLWASNIRPRALGRYLSDHTFTFTQVVLKKDIVESIPKQVRFAVELAKNDPTDPIPIPMTDPPPMLWIPVSDGRFWHCQIHRDSFQFGGLPPDVDSRLVVDLRWFGPIHPVNTNRVTFEGDIFDKFGMPQPTFDVTYGEEDREIAHTMMEDMTEVAGLLGGFLSGSEPRFMPPGAALHVMGTTRMGETDDGTSVVDPYSKVWGFSNLYIAGNGVIPTRTAANPTLTTVALAHRAARRIAEGGSK